MLPDVLSRCPLSFFSIFVILIYGLLFSSNQNIDSISDLLREVYAYVDLRVKHFRLDFVSKLTVLASALLLSVVLLVIFAVALLFLAYMGTLLLADVVGGLEPACAIIATACLLLGLGIYLLRKPLIVRPLTNFLARLFLDDDEDGAPDNQDKEERP